MTMIHRVSWCLSVCCLVALSGCGESVKGVDPKLVSVTGKVTLDGKPLTKGSIGFVAAGEGAKSYAGTIDGSGNYSLAYSQSAKGALPGDYKVRVESLEGGAPTMGEKGEVSKPKSLVPEKYNNPETSGLTAKVENKSNVINFDLKSQ